MSNNWSYKFRTTVKEEEVKMVNVILKTKEVITLQASLLYSYINKHHGDVYTYVFI
ncbi:hypothetical protein G8V07_11565 [Clostridium botulinum D/C]|uniref:hypothetical protein n=1 Tax=Clostridium botulinum TaxID=1491 RepID=UPI001E458B60|nr:hypothetical protein [Clostridium botulinum]MCD3319521.1 hypothetical protein [Clostridium botulinum D/C]MCD3324386.1 hypothetical protein [Clostridium botulinum D/C]MCD3327822.1 hypothetical protein [Clostridium botulinum D/C]